MKVNISVIIPLYNKEAIIERSLKSVLSQDYGDFEVIIVNDGSTDHSMEIVRSIQDPRIVLIEQENGGPSKARNTGIKHAKGEWIVFLDADDELLPNALSHFRALIEDYPKATMIVCPFYIDNGVTRKLWRLKASWQVNPFKTHFFDVFYTRTGNFICTKELLHKHSFNEHLRRYEDFELWFRLYKDAIIYVSSRPSLVVNAKHAEASSARKDIKEDFVGHLDFSDKSFWEFMCLYKLYLSERPHYKGQTEKLYPTLKYRFDLLLVYKLLTFCKPKV